MEGVPAQQNANLLAILKWSLGQSNDGTSSSSSSFAAMSEEDRAFLAAALSETIKDEPSRMQV